KNRRRRCALIFIEQRGADRFAIQFKPVGDNLSRVKELEGAEFDGEKSWTVPLSQLLLFEQKFKGEFIYVTPRHVLLGYPAPPLPKMYEKIPNVPVTRIKAPYT